MKKMSNLQRFPKDTHWYRSNYTMKPVITLLLYSYCVLTFLSVVGSAEISLECEDGWTLITPSKRCYKYFEGACSWQVARSTCIGYSAVLAEPVGYEVNTELGKLMKNVSSNAKNAWIGYNYKNDHTTKSNMETGYWSDWSQASITVAFWDINQPSLDSGRCVDIIQTTKGQWKWRLSPCGDGKPFLCQRTACMKGTFNCHISGKHSACIAKAKVCNGFSDCPNGFDESNCPEKNRFFIREDSGEINFTNIIRPNNTTNYGSIYQWTIEGKIGSKLYVALDARKALNVLSVLQIWIGGPTIQKSYLFGTYAHALNRVVDTISTNNFAIITWAVYDNDLQKVPKITWSSDPKCYWAKSSNRSASDAVPIASIDLGQEDTINNCLDACNSTCSIVTVHKIEKKCYFYKLLPLVLTSSCCESYVKLCPAMSHGPHQLAVIPIFQDIHSAKYPLEYSKNEDHTWILTAPLWKIITLQFIDVDLDRQASIIVYNGKISANKVLARLVNGSDPITLFSLGNILTIRFVTGPEPVHRRGFLARYKSGCDLTVKSEYVHIQSPGYDISMSYPVRFNCTWTVHSVTEPPRLTMRFDPKFALKKDKDYLQVYNGTKSKEHAQFSGQGITGNTAPPILKSNSGLFILRFMLTAIRSDIGFRATIFSNNYCGPLPDLSNGSWKSVSGYYSGNSATYKCLENYMNATANTIHCTHKGNWETDPKCVVKPCPPLYNLTHGHWVKEPGTNNYRAVCDHYTRQKGYPITICWDGKWQGKPTCEKIRCEDFFLPRNASGITPTTELMKGDTVNVTCAKGYQLKGKNPFWCGVDETPICEDIDECAENATLCEQVCVNTPSSYECICFPGYQKDTDSSRSCKDVDECKINNGECSHNCTNQLGSYKCSCPKGWELFTTNGQLNVTVLQGDTGHDPGDYYRFNHTCVKVFCPRPDITNGILLTGTSHFYFNDSVNILCQNGYYLDGTWFATCLETGNWTSLPTCKRATCPPVISKLGVVNPPGRLDFGQNVSIDCSNGTTDMKYRRCVWNLHNKTFSTVGDSPQCEVINCSHPKRIPGTKPYQYDCTTAGCSFNFTCLPTFTLTGSGSGPNNQTVTCNRDGLWKFNDLACNGPTCNDPGRPAGGEQIGKSYEEGSLITFRCFRHGFVPSNPYPLKCVYNGSMNWNGTVPQCIDREKPTLSNCPSKSMHVEKMKELNIPMPTADDNSGEYIAVKVTPKKFRTDQLILTDMNVTYTATDYANNTATCSLQIKLKDFEKPMLTCPTIKNFLLFGAVTLTKDNFPVNVSDNSGQVSLTYEPTTLKIGDRPNAAYVVKVTATDPTNNTATCYIQVKTEDAPNTKCDRKRLLIPHSEISSCGNDTANISCNVSCTKGNLFYDKPALNNRRIVCDPSTGWLTAGIYCVSQQKTAYQIVLVYKYKTQNQTCVQKSLETQMTSFYQAFSDIIGRIYTYDVKATKPSIRNLQEVSTIKSGEYVSASLRIELISENAPANDMDIVANMSVLPVYGDIRAKKFVIDCGKTDAVTIARTGFVCEYSAKAFIINNKAMCVSCPPGTYGKDFNKCAPCQEHFYNNNYNMTQCTACPPDTYVNKNGSTSVTSCYSKCPPGYHSANGLIPCMPCPEQTYSYNTTMCKSCSPGKKTAGWGASSASECKNECQPGSYSQTGFVPCKPCPPNTYGEFSAAKMCDPCPDTSFIKSNGSTNRTDCKPNLVCTGNVCKNGGSCNTFNENYYCDCLRGFKGQNCSEIIDPCRSRPCFYNKTCSQINQTSSYKCNCGNGYSGLQCEKNFCESGAKCQHGGVCKDVVGDYECLCPSWSGYTGKRCEIKSLPCQLLKCQNNATCIPGGTIRVQCVCQPGFTGELCEKNIDDCDHDQCMNGGTCVDEVNGFSCKCKTGFDGRFCESAKDPCNSSPCGKNQLCKWDYTNNTHYCICVNDFIPNPQNERECIARDLCKVTPCKNNGRCHTSPKPFNCSCQPDYFGSTCQRSECTRNSACKKGEECRMIGGRRKCVCKTPLIGGVRCLEAIDYCKDNHCNQVGTDKCISMTHDYKCNCSEGFSGRYCQVKPCNPRCINGECIKQAGNWSCKCQPGWKGDNCTELIDQCDNNPCRNNANCYGNSNEYFCMCPVGFWDKTCNETINFCEKANPCVGNGSLCQSHLKHATCTCPKGQSGSGCQISSLCTSTTCENGGTCEVRSSKTNCICPIGFGGESCNITLDPCDTIKTCNKSDCERQGQRAFCKCDFKKMGPSCQHDVLYEVDLSFPRRKGLMQSTPIPMWSRLTRDFLTLSFWIKYYLPVQGLTTSLVLYGTEKSDGKSQIYELLSLKRSSLKIQFSGTIETFDLINLDDGKWHHVFVSWSNYSLSLYLDSQLITNNEYGNNTILPKFGLLIPAGTIDESKHIVKPSQFVGRISRLILLNSTWTAEEVKTYWNKVTQLQDKALVNFYRNVLTMTHVILDFESEINQNMCELSTNCTNNTKSIFPTVDMCPHDQMKVASRWAKLDWVQPIFTHNSTTVSNYKPGESYFDWGPHTIVYYAFGEKNHTSAVCTFQLFSRRFSCNETISTSYMNETGRNCQEHNQTIICTPDCQELNMMPAIPGPLVYSCGVPQMWGKQQTSRFTFASCTMAKTMPKVNYEIEMVIRFDGPQSDVCREIQTYFHSFLKTHNLCSNNCTECSLKSTNTTRKKRSVSNIPVQLKVNIVNAKLSDGTPTKDFLLAQILAYNKLENKLLNASILDGSVRIKTTCPTGQQVNGQNCVALTPVPGTFANNVTNQIEGCPKGTYQPNAGKTSCIQCPSKKTTMGEFSDSENECIDMCTVGYHFSSKDNKCIACEKGFYQNKEGSLSCDYCKDGKVTREKASKSITECIGPETTTVVIQLRTLPTNDPGAAAVTKAGLSARDIAIIAVFTILGIFFLLCIVVFCCRAKIRKFCTCLKNNKVAAAPEQKDRYTKGNVKMVSYNLTNIRERRLGAGGNDPKAFPQSDYPRNVYPENYNDNHSDVSSSLEGSTQDVLPLTKRRSNGVKSIKQNQNSNQWLSNGDALMQMHQQPRIGAESESRGLLVRPKPKRPKNNVVKVHLSNFPRKEPKIMIDSDEEDVR